MRPLSASAQFAPSKRADRTVETAIQPTKLNGPRIRPTPGERLR